MQTPNPSFEKHWLRWLFGIWVIMACVLLAYRWQNMNFLILADTDDNLRLAQVKAWLAGQGWYDLRQYKLDPPLGADIHWSRIADLPIAAIISLMAPLVGPLMAEKIAIGIAPLLPLALALFSLALVGRRVVHPLAWHFAAILLFCAPSTMGMFLPTRIDHHGWQLAFLALALAGLADPERARGGLTMGLATALSISVGLEMLPYLALCGGLTGLRWVIDGQQGPRLRAYGLSLGLGTALGYLLFASYANQAPRCDALTPVWLSTLLLAGAGMVVLSFVPKRSWLMRLGAGSVIAAGLATFFAMAWPDCLTRPEGISDALYKQWFVNIMEVRPLPQHGLKTALTDTALPAMGIIGAIYGLWRDEARRVIWAQFLLLGVASFAMMFWQLRAAPAAQLLALPGVIFLAWAVVPPLSRSPYFVVRVFGISAALLLISGLFMQGVTRVLPEKAKTQSVRTKARQASAACTTLSALRPIGRVPAATMFTFVDLSPRLIAMTPHRAIAGPYHRNGDAILDVFRAFRGTPETARQIMARHGADYVLICPNMAEGGNHRRSAPKGFLAQLEKGQVPSWLTPVVLPAKSPFKLWKITPER
jgi:hypothetical protein